MKKTYKQYQQDKKGYLEFISKFTRKPKFKEYIYFGQNTPRDTVKKIKYFLNQKHYKEEDLYVVKGELGYKVVIDYNKAPIEDRMAVDNAAKLLGSLGGQVTLKKYGKEKMKEWGKKGGRPKKSVL